MVDRLTVVSGNEKQKKWPKEGDVFYFQLNDGRLGYGMVSLGKIDVGPFNNAIVIYLYNNFTSSLQEDVKLAKDNLLLPPIITDNSCWKKGYFVTFKTIETSEVDVLSQHYFKNPVRNKIYDQHGVEIDSPIENMPIGEESIQFYKSVIKSIESFVN
ncbi:Imm26 family immunity protein [bacterium BS0013]